MFQEVNDLLKLLFFLISAGNVIEGSFSCTCTRFKVSLAEGGILTAAAALFHHEIEDSDTQQNGENDRDKGIEPGSVGNLDIVLFQRFIGILFVILNTVVLSILIEDINIWNVILLFSSLTTELINQLTGTKIELIVADLIVIEVADDFGIIGLVGTAADFAADKIDAEYSYDNDHNVGKNAFAFFRCQAIHSNLKQ